jgi:hypothetical protein
MSVVSFFRQVAPQLRLTGVDRTGLALASTAAHDPMRPIGVIEPSVGF